MRADESTVARTPTGPGTRAGRASRARATVAVAVVATLSLTVAACTGTDSFGVKVQKAKLAASTTTTEPPDCAAMLPPEALAGQLLMVMVANPAQAAEDLSSGKVGGFGLKGAQSASIDSQVADAVAGAPLQPFVAADEEGGTVQRLAAALGRLPSQTTFGNGTVEAAQEAYRRHDSGMRDLGFNMTFAPVADVGSGSGLGTRTFGTDPAKVSQFVVASVEVAEGSGLIPVVKHWPGIGGGTADPHVKLTTLAPVDQLRTKDLVPFQAAFDAGAPAVMLTHAVVPGLTEPGVPASLSSAAINGELRGRQGFDGLVITDSLGMGAVVKQFPQPQAAEQAIAAGADVALLSGGDVVDETHARLTEAITADRLPREQVLASVRRVLELKGVDGPCIGVVTRYASAAQAAQACEDAAAEDAATRTDDEDGTSGSSSGSSSGATDCTTTTVDDAAPTTIDAGINDDGSDDDLTTTTVRRTTSTTTTLRTTTTVRRSTTTTEDTTEPNPDDFDVVTPDEPAG
ncbi:MAG: glycoside hydrolase family 3 N-terminal domain-containing protein [Actinomycetes bacterium]